MFGRYDHSCADATRCSALVREQELGDGQKELDRRRVLLILGSLLGCLLPLGRLDRAQLLLPLLLFGLRIDLLLLGGPLGGLLDGGVRALLLGRC